MRLVQPLNENWIFQKGEEAPVTVTLPHCWNAVDGQDGSPMYRGTGTYTRTLTLTADKLKKTCWLEVGAAALSSQVTVNGQHCGESRCGYAMYRVPLSGALREGENTIQITVSNGVNNNIYPGMADFSFYGGLYRTVSLILEDDLHFVEDDGSRDGIVLVPSVKGKDGLLALTVSAAAPEAYTCRALLLDGAGKQVAQKELQTTEANITLELSAPDVHLWDGVADPYLYTVVVTLLDRQGRAQDERRLQTGFRTITYDRERGLLLNGRPYQLHGMARHQDFGGIGNALTRNELETDLRLLLEMGANAVRCAHYQHMDEWYSLCDQYGLLVWAEIPLISAVVQSRQADENARQQLDALLAQARNHCSIYCWGIQNEIGIASKNQYAFDLVKGLADHARAVDSTRLTGQCNEYGTEDDCPVTYHTDLLGYNLYYGWYYGQMEDLGPRLDGIRAAHPDIPIMVTEYGVDTNPRFHSLTPKANDYSEEYQLQFVANALKTYEERPWLAGSYAWVMCDFGSAGRDEGGAKGKNQKGIVTIDRKLKKDAFYLYKAHWSREPFVYLAGRRFVNRPQEATGITVLTNMEQVTLTVNGAAVDTKAAQPMTLFADVALLPGENRVTVTARNGDGTTRTDSITLCRVEQPDPAYQAPVKTQAQTAVNWFENIDPIDLTGEEKPLRPEGFTADNTIQELFSHKAVAEIISKYLNPLVDNPRFDPNSPISLKRLLGLARMDVPAALLRKVEQEINAYDK